MKFLLFNYGSLFVACFLCILVILEYFLVHCLVRCIEDYFVLSHVYSCINKPCISPIDKVAFLLTRDLEFESCIKNSW